MRASMAAASVTSPCTALSRASQSARDRRSDARTSPRSYSVTSCPPARRASATLRPTKPVPPKMTIFIARDPPSQQLCPEIPLRIHVGNKPPGRLGRLAPAACQELAAAGAREALVTVDDHPATRQHRNRPALQLPSRKRRIAGEIVHHLIGDLDL